MGATRGLVGLWSVEPRVTGAPLCAKCLSMCSWFEPSGSAVVYLWTWSIWISLLLEGSASAFIDEGDGLTSEREGVRSLLSLASQAGGYEIMVGAHNMLDVRCTWEVKSSSLGMADVGACYTIDAQRHVRGFTMFARYGKCRRTQHCRYLEACGGSLTVWELMACIIL